nr:unnamed protein product [Spirometra erinaceieuropaei]
MPLCCLCLDWLDDNDATISDLLTRKNRLNRAYLNRLVDANRATIYRCRRLALKRLHEIQDAWMAQKAEEIQGYADRNDTKNLFAATKTIYGLQTKTLRSFSPPMGRRLWRRSRRF